jgi:hypothetical protein
MAFGDKVLRKMSVLFFNTITKHLRKGFLGPTEVVVHGHLASLLLDL